MTEADLLRENAELRAKHSETVEAYAHLAERFKALTASNARTRGALKACRHWVRAPHPETAAGALNMPRWNADMKLVADVLAETPAASLAAITAPLEAHIAELREEMADVLTQSTNWMKKFDARQETIRLMELNNAQLRKAARDVLDSTPYHIISCRYLDTFGDEPCNCPLGAKRMHMEELIVRTPANSLEANQNPLPEEIAALKQKLAEAQSQRDLAQQFQAEIWKVTTPCEPDVVIRTIQAAARAEEREACITAIEDKADGRSTIPVSEVLWAIHNRAKKA